MNKLLNFKEKFLLVFVISSMILGAFLEVVSIGVFLPFISQLLDLNYSENIGILNKFNTLISNFFGDISVMQLAIIFTSVFIFKNFFIYFGHFINSYFSYIVSSHNIFVAY